MKLLRLTLVSALLASAPSAFGQEDWSDLSYVDGYSFSSNYVEATPTGFERFTLNFELRDGDRLVQNPNVLCGPITFLFNAGFLPPQCNGFVPQLSEDVELAGRIADLEFTPNRRDLVREIFGDAAADAAVEIKPGILGVPDSALPVQVRINGDAFTGGIRYRVSARTGRQEPRLSDFARYTSVVENRSLIASNSDAIDANTSAIAENSDAIAVNAAAISENSEAIEENEEAIAENSNAITLNSTSIARNSEAISSNAVDISRNLAAIDGLRFSVQELGGRVSALEADMADNRVGIAIAMAMSGGTPLQAGESFRVNANWGAWGGENAYSISASYRINRRFIGAAAFGGGFGSDEMGGRAGVSFGW